MPAARTLKPARSDAVFKYYEHVAREDLKEICYRLHEIILDAAPDLSYDKKWDGACYYQNWICAMIVPSGNYVRFHLSHGAEVPDPSGLLEGTGKGIRHMKIHTFEEIPAEQVKEWIRHELILDARDAGTPPPEGVAPLEPATASAPATPAPAAVAPPAKKKAKAPARKTAAKKAPPKKKAAAPAKAKKAAAKKAPAKKGAKKPAKAAPKKATAKKPAGKKKAPAKKGGVKKAAPKKAAAKRAPLKKGATKTAARKAPAKRAPVKKAAKKGRAGKR